ncbi:MAG: HAD family hydrolase [Dysosmobacter welbionis]
MFWKRITDGVKAYKQWSEGNMLEKSRRRFGRTGIFGTLPLTGKSCCPSPRSWPTCGRSPSTTGLRDGAAEMLQALKSRGYHLGVISNNASLYNVFRVLEDYGIRGFMEDVTVSSVTGYRKPHPEIFRIALRQMQAKPEMCVYVGDTVSRDIIGPKGGLCQGRADPLLPVGQKDVHVVRMRHSRTRLSEH